MGTRKRKRMKHFCAIFQEEAFIPKPKSTDGLFTWLRHWFLQWRIVDPQSPLAHEFLGGEMETYREGKRQYQYFSGTIHPFSIFKRYWEMFMIVVYTVSIMVIPFDFAFYAFDRKPSNTLYLFLTLRAIWMVDIIVTFFCGYEDVYAKKIILERWLITMRYIKGPHFTCDVLSTLTYEFLCLADDSCFLDIQTREILYIFKTVFSVLKLIKIFTIYENIGRLISYWKLNFKLWPYVVLIIYFYLIGVHWMACLHFWMSSLRIRIDPSLLHYSWIYKWGIIDRPIYSQYIRSFYRSSAFSLFVRIQSPFDSVLWDETFLILSNFLLGIIFIGFNLVILLTKIISANQMDIKFHEIVNELKEYTNHKQLPQELSRSLRMYYDFKYQRKFIQNDLIKNVLSDKLNSDLEVHLMRRLISTVPIFRVIGLGDTKRLVSFLKREMYLPKDVIVQAGTKGDSMYFISSGTVAVYTQTGRELCHLEDGAYFGEISLLMKTLRSASVVALEVTEVYRLDRNSFEICFARESSAYEKVMETARERLHYTKTIESEHNRMMYAAQLNKFSTSV